MTIVDELVRRSTAVVGVGATKLGTAFRIAPEYAVTAAHVVHSVRESSLTLRFEAGASCQAEVVAVGEPPTRQDGEESILRWPYPDLAVLKLEQGALPGVPCVMMAEPVFDDALYQGALSLQVCGYNAVWTELWAGICTLSDETSKYLKLDGAVFRPGLSGAPVYSRELGVVLGVVKASEDTRVPTGGLATKLLPGLRTLCDGDLYQEIVRSHDGYHAQAPEWRSIGNRADRMLFAAFVGHLAEIPGRPRADDLAAFLDLLCGYPGSAPEPRRLVALRDLAEFVHNEMPQARRQPHILSKLCHKWPESIQVPDELREKLWTVADQLSAGNSCPTTQRPTPGSGFRVPAVMGVITPVDVAGRRTAPHLVELFTWNGGEVTPWLRRETQDYPSAKHELQRLLHEYVQQNPKVEIEVVLPDEYLNEENLVSWRRQPGSDDPRKFSEKYDIFLRRRRTWEKSEEQKSDLLQHWEMLDRSPGGLHWLHCDDHSDTATIYKEIHTPEEGPALHGLGAFDPSIEAALRTAEFDSLPVIVWRSEECTDHDEPGRQYPCVGARFHDALVSSLGTKPATQWYKAIKDVQVAWDRSRLTAEDPRYPWREAVYILDRPGRSKPRIPLAGTE
jgi:hypothetical protein